MNLLIQIIERNPTDHTVTARFTTDKVSAAVLSPQMEAGSPKLRQDGLVARCDGDLCIWVGTPEPVDAALQTLLTKYAPKTVLHAAEVQVDPSATLSIDSVSMLAEQAITLP